MPLNAQRRQDLSRLIPEGLVATRRWLTSEGLGRHAVDNLVKADQLQPLMNGVYTRPGTSLTWQAVVCSLQHLPPTGLVVGGLTALDLQGLTHYTAEGPMKTIHLYGVDELPTWVNAVLPNVHFMRHNSNELRGRSLVNHEYSVRDQTLHNRDPLQGFTETLTWREDVWPLTTSSPERAILEVLMDVPTTVSFEHADQLMQGLTSLSPRRLQSLLELCRNIKVRRLFLWLAERHKYSWLAKLDTEKIDLGSGKRVLAENGKLDPKFLITVPSEMHGDGQ